MIANDLSNLHVGFVGVPPGTTTIRLGDGRTVALGDFFDGVQYGVGEFSTADTDSVEPFVNGRGGTLPGGTRSASKVDNNTPRQGGMGLPPSWEMWVYAVGYELTRAVGSSSISAFSDPVNLATAFDLCRKIYAEYKYNDVLYVEGTLLDNPPGVGLGGFTSNAAKEVIQAGIPSPRDRVSMELPLQEEQGIAYKAVLTPVTALTISQSATDGSGTLNTVDVKVRKYGIIRRNVGAGGQGTRMG